MIDYAITTLNVVYWTTMAAWLIVLITDNDSLTGWGSAGFMSTALIAVLGWHLLRYRRKKLRGENPERPE